jgi:hypothetical protein
MLGLPFFPPRQECRDYLFVCGGDGVFGGLWWPSAIVDRPVLSDIDFRVSAGCSDCHCAEC